ncbi:hypothetical protein CJF30_00004499 [Rutstroemia sp. NJR-2017a BBW]|nr:hypothetical protein CJF30_00004499 [Rutstroemia sp. NJR-2017a BBW]
MDKASFGSATEKRGVLFAPYAYLSPEATSGLASRSLFWWLNPLFRLGFRGTVNDGGLFAVDEDLLSRACKSRFAQHWVNRTKYPKKHTLVWVMLRAMLKPLTASILPRLALIFFKFMQPLLIKRVTDLNSDKNSESVDRNGWGLTAATGLVFIGSAITSATYQHKANRMVTMVRGSLVGAIYAQTLDLSIMSLDESAAVTLMSSDVERICVALQPIHTLWSSPIEIGLAIWLLQQEVGIALLGPLFITAIAMSGPFLTSKHLGSAQMIWMEKIQTRVDATVKMLQTMKGVKMLGLSSRMSRTIFLLRSEEILESLKMRKLFIGMIAFGNVSTMFTPGAAFIIYVIVASVNGQILNVSSAFTALSLITLLVAPIRAIVFAIPPLRAAVGCFDRIETFITSTTRRDHRMLFPRAQGQSSGMPGLDRFSGSTATGPDIELQPIAPRMNANSSSAVISVRNLTLSWPNADRPVIADISFDIQPGNLTMIIGPVASGKSSLLRGLLGEIPSSKGNVYNDLAHAAFVDQAPWIQNCSLRDNIVGVRDFEPEWYASVVRACAFDTDIESLPEGDDTNAGSAGSAISGGQKLRIALARAIYSRHQILILDDVFSGLDSISEDRVFSRLLGRSGLLRRLGTSVILVTHAAHRLSHADHIIALSAEGTVSEQGNFQHLLANNGYVSGLTARHIIISETDALEEELSVKAKVDDDTSRRNAAADVHRPVGDWSTYKYYFSSLGRRNLIVWAGLMLAYSMLLQFPDLWIKFWTSAITTHGNSVNGRYLGILVAVECTAMVTLMVLTGMLLIKMIPHSAAYLHEQLLRTVENAPLSFLTSTDTGEIVNRFSQDLSVIDSGLPIAGLVVANNVFIGIIQAILICISASYFSITVPIVLIAMYLLQKVYLRTSRQIRLMDLEMKAPLYSNFLETLSGLVTIRAFGWTVWLMLVIDLLVAGLAVILVALIVKLRHNTDGGFVGLALVNIMSFNMTLSAVIIHWTATETSLGAIARIKSFVRNTSSEHRPEECRQVPQNWPSKGEIFVSDISASYALDQSPSLCNISLSVNAGQKIGVCGPSGAGKSSFVALLLHMMEVIQGSITIDGADILTIPRNVLRERLTVIPQEPVFIKGSIRENLDTLGLANNDVTADEVLRKVGLWSIVTNAGGLDVPLEAEELLSHGQRQLFCLARAMLRRSKILIIDEATASVDVQTDELMQKIILDHFADCTIIAVAHRLQTIRHFDKIAVFENGVVEFGKPDALLADEGSKFKALWDL